MCNDLTYIFYKVLKFSYYITLTFRQKERVTLTVPFPLSSDVIEFLEVFRSLTTLYANSLVSP